jgi:uncharacterized repeat protein (TIGR01451 family)
VITTALRAARALVFIGSFVALAASTGEGAPVAGTRVDNTATATYLDAAGEKLGAQSNTVAVTVNRVGAIVVSPKEKAVDPGTESYPIGTPIVRTFTILNAGNVTDAYTITSVSAAPAKITSVTFVTSSGSSIAAKTGAGATVSPSVAPGGTIEARVALTTAGIPANQPFAIDLAARSTALTGNGLVSDSGREWAVATPPAVIGGLTGSDSAIRKLVNGFKTIVSTPGQTVVYTIGFENYGGSPATNAVLTDVVPNGLSILPRTIELNGSDISSEASVNGQTLTIKLASIPVRVTEMVSFSAIVTSVPPGNSFVNIASLAADGMKSMTTTPASVFVGAANVVFDGYAGAATPIAGAVVTLRDASGAIVALPQKNGSLSVGIAPNLGNVNPFTTVSDGGYSFVFAQSQLGTNVQPGRYELDASATGYQSRRIGVTLTPDASGVLYSASLQSLDNQPLAAPGTFSLTTSNVTLPEVFGLLGNIPMFGQHPLTISKTVDRDVATAGDRLAYSIQYGAAASTLATVQIVDMLPAGVAYAPGTARVDNAPLEPARIGSTLRWNFKNVAGQHTITYDAVITPSVTDGSTLVNVVDVDAAAASGARLTATASAGTQVIAGPLGHRVIITGRVFVDRARTGHFTEGDAGVPGVTIYLEDGEYVVTDNYGRYSFPAAKPGQHVLRVDETTLPPTVRAYDDHRIDSPRSLQRLVHGIFDSDLMQDVNFAVAPV